MTSSQSLLTAEEVANELLVDSDTVLRWARKGEIPSVTLPGGRGLKRFRRDDIEAIVRGDKPHEVPCDHAACQPAGDEPPAAAS